MTFTILLVSTTETGHHCRLQTPVSVSHLKSTDTTTDKVKEIREQIHITSTKLDQIMNTERISGSN